MKSKIKLVVQNVHMGLGHDGLRNLLKKEAKLDVLNLETSELVLCLNTKGDKLKVIGGKGLILGYMKTPNGQLIMKEALRYLPETFGGEGFNYDSAVKQAIQDKLNPDSQRNQKPHSLKQYEDLRKAGIMT